LRGRLDPGLHTHQHRRPDRVFQNYRGRTFRRREPLGLRRIESFGGTLIRSEYPLDRDAYQAVDSVVVTDHAGSKRTLGPGDYEDDRAATLLRFDPGSRGAEDEALAVNVARHCERIVE
jgi:hypothetical protein